MIAGGNKDARDMRDMEMERRLRDGEDSQPWKELGGFEKHTKVRMEITRKPVIMDDILHNIYFLIINQTPLHIVMVS